MIGNDSSHVNMDISWTWIDSHFHTAPVSALNSSNTHWAIWEAVENYSGIRRQTCHKKIIPFLIQAIKIDRWYSKMFSNPLTKLIRFMGGVHVILEDTGILVVEAIYCTCWTCDHLQDRTIPRGDHCSLQNQDHYPGFDKWFFYMLFGCTSELLSGEVQSINTIPYLSRIVDR